MARVDTVRVISIRKIRHPVPGGVACPWWVDCPCCSTSEGGFTTHATQAYALAWALVHIAEHNKPKTYVEISTP